MKYSLGCIEGTDLTEERHHSSLHEQKAASNKCRRREALELRDDLGQCWRQDKLVTRIPTGQLLIRQRILEARDLQGNGEEGRLAERNASRS